MKVTRWGIRSKYLTWNCEGILKKSPGEEAVMLNTSWVSRLFALLSGHAASLSSLRDISSGM